MAGPLLQLIGVTVRYGVVEAVREASLRVDEGELVALIGPNGAGKSSLLNATVGLAPAVAGEVVFDRRPIARLSTEAIVRRGLVLVPEGRRVFGALTVRENLRLGAYLRRDRAAVAREVDALLERFPILAERVEEPAGSLSGGEAQQLAICRALVGAPRLVLLDEPSLGLAPQLVEAIYEVIGELRAAGRTILVVEQSAHVALRLADRAYVAAAGAVHEAGSVAELLDEKRLREAYLGRSPQEEAAAWAS